MATYRASSWGRTRRPKDLREDVEGLADKQTAVQVTTVAVGDLENNLNSATAGENGYLTENQRYLHIMIQDDAADENLTLYGYNYAFGKWATLYIPVGVKNGADTTAELSYVAATFTSIAGRKMFTIPIHGIDRIAFVDDGSTDDEFKVWAACSTF